MTETKKPTADDVKRLDDKATRLARELSETKDELRLATLTYWGCKIGDPVRETKKREPRTGTIFGVEYAAGGTKSRPWIGVRLNKKDGTPGERVVNFYSDWERVEDSATEAA